MMQFKVGDLVTFSKDRYEVNKPGTFINDLIRITAIYDGSCSGTSVVDDYQYTSIDYQGICLADEADVAAGIACKMSGGFPKTQAHAGNTK